MAVIGFDPVEYTVDEDEGVVEFMIRLISGTISKNVEIEFFTNDSSAEGEDFELLL